MQTRTIAQIIIRSICVVPLLLCAIFVGIGKLVCFSDFTSEMYSNFIDYAMLDPYRDDQPGPLSPELIEKPRLTPSFCYCNVPIALWKFGLIGQYFVLVSTVLLILAALGLAIGAACRMSKNLGIGLCSATLPFPLVIGSLEAWYAVSSSSLVKNASDIQQLKDLLLKYPHISECYVVFLIHSFSDSRIFVQSWMAASVHHYCSLFIVSILLGCDIAASVIVFDQEPSDVPSAELEINQPGFPIKQPPHEDVVVKSFH